MILVTGATGFVGSALIKRLMAVGSYGGVLAALRRLDASLPDGVEHVSVGDLLPTTDWSTALRRVDVVIHCAARVHVMHDSVKNPLEAYRHVNVQGTLHLARQAVRAGVQRFVFVSSIGVNGAETFDRPYSADDITAPHSAYAISKFEAEQGLLTLSAETGMEIVIVRPPLVYGPNAPGNFGTLMRWVALGLPLPFGCIHNKRSFVGLDNLTDFLVACLTHPSAAGQTFLVSDGEDVSTTQLLQRTAKAMGKQAMLLPVPVGFLQRGAALLGKRDVAQRLCGSLQVDIGKTRRLLGWNPPLTLDQGLKKAVEGMKP